MSRRLAQVVEAKENQSRLIEDLEAAKMNVTSEVQRTRYDVETSVNFLTSLLALVGRPVRSSDGHSLGQLQQSVHTAVVEMTGELERAQVDLSSLHSQVAVLEGRVGDMDQVLRQEELLEADREELRRRLDAAKDGEAHALAAVRMLVRVLVPLRSRVRELSAHKKMLAQELSSKQTLQAEIQSLSLAIRGADGYDPDAARFHTHVKPVTFRAVAVAVIAANRLRRMLAASNRAGHSPHGDVLPSSALAPVDHVPHVGSDAQSAVRILLHHFVPSHALDPSPALLADSPLIRRLHAGLLAGRPASGVAVNPGRPLRAEAIGMQATLGEAGLAGIRHMALSLVRQEELLEADNEQLERVNKAAQQEVDELSAALEEARQTARSLQLEANQAADAVSTHQSASHARIGDLERHVRGRPREARRRLLRRRPSLS